MSTFKKWIILQSILLIVLFCIAELSVRWMGYSAGDLRPNWSNFHPVDSLEVYNDFYTDSSGILVANNSISKGINVEGFRAPEFKSLDTVKHKVLFLGDSFTWGLSAAHIDSCFADLVSSKVSETIVNTGIPIADPAQYDAIAQKYIPTLKPEKVLLFFYLGNDIMLQERPVVPLKPFYFYTNAGALLAQDGPHHFEAAKEAYEYFTRQKFFLLHPKNVVEKVISKSAFLSRVYSFKYRWEEKRATENAIENMTVTQKHLYAIVKVCKQNNCALKIVLIPEIKEANEPLAFFQKRYKGFFEDEILKSLVYLPDGNFSQNYVPYPDGHLNNKGHAFYAEKILELLKGMR